jgi:2-polyprenyl-3-methyl-5-hydroxy-6-metoxy-1,4-benzoquinol methylase
VFASPLRSHAPLTRLKAVFFPADEKKQTSEQKNQSTKIRDRDMGDRDMGQVALSVEAVSGADERTLGHYQAHVERYVELYNSVSVPRLEALMLSFFHQGGRTLDIGCASGRDMATLKRLGFEVEGLDAVKGFVEVCRARFPTLKVHHSALPELEDLFKGRDHREGHYDNLLASAVLMHLPKRAQQRALSQLARLLRPGGRALISVRSSRDQTSAQKGESWEGDHREGERLFTPLSVSELTLLCEDLNLRVIYSEERVEELVEGGDETQAGKRWVTVVVEQALTSPLHSGVPSASSAP